MGAILRGGLPGKCDRCSSSKVEKGQNLAELGKIVSLATFVGAMGTLIFRLMWF
jgi:hypothetical protein